VLFFFLDVFVNFATFEVFVQRQPSVSAAGHDPPDIATR